MKNAESSLITIGNTKIGPGFPVYVIAEISANHNKEYEQAVALIKAAKEAGADAVKLQTYTADTMTIQSNRPEFQISGGTLWDGKTLYDLYAEAYMPWEWQPKLKKVADELGIDLFSTPFDKTAVDFLEEMAVPAYKVASFEIVDIPLIQYIASKGKPIIISTGMATLTEIDEALQAAKKAGSSQIILLKCTSTYPSSPDAMNLRSISHLIKEFRGPVGLSDHTLGVTVPVVATALGACVIEKHLTFSRSIPGTDSAFSTEPQEFKAMVDAIRVAEKSQGKALYEVPNYDAKNRVFRRSLYVVKNIKAGETFTEKNLRSIRPSSGLHPHHLQDVLGQHAKQDIKKGTPLSWELIDQATERH